MARLYKGNEIKYHTGIKVPDGTIKEITLTFFTDDKASFKKTYSKNEIEVIDSELSCNIDKKDTLLLNEGVLNCMMESSVIKDGFPDTFDSVFKFNTPFYLKEIPNPVEIKYQEKTVTDNGTYTADDGYVALSKVNVDVDLDTPYNNGYESGKEVGKQEQAAEDRNKLTELTVTSNGSYMADYGYNAVNVDVPLKNIQETKEVSYSENGNYTINPEDGYDAIEGVNVTVAVPISDTNSVTIDELPDYGTDKSWNFTNYGKKVTLKYRMHNEEKMLDVNQNGTYEILPTSGKSYIISKATVNVNVPEKTFITQEKTVTENGEVVPDSGYDGLSKVTVNVAGSVIDLSKDITQPYVSLNVRDFTADNFNALTGYENLTSLNNKFSYMKAIAPSSTDDVTVTLDLPNVVDASYFLSNLTGSSSQCKINLSFTERSFKKCKKFDHFMERIQNVTFLNPNIDVDLSNATNLDYCYYNFYPMGNATCKANISSKCTSLKEFGYMSSVNFNWTDADTSNVDNFYEFLAMAPLTDIPLLDFSKATDISYMLRNCPKLTNVGGFLNLGKSLGSYGNNLNLSTSSKLTTESVLNIFNNLYSVDSTFGCRIRLNSTVYGKLTEDQIAIATDKGWTVTT